MNDSKYARDRGLIARMAGNIAGPLAAVAIDRALSDRSTSERHRIIADESVGLAVAILERIDALRGEE